jgi:hypothetical protein
MRPFSSATSPPPFVALGAGLARPTSQVSALPHRGQLPGVSPMSTSAAGAHTSARFVPSQLSLFEPQPGAPHSEVSHQERLTRSSTGRDLPTFDAHTSSSASSSRLPPLARPESLQELVHLPRTHAPFASPPLPTRPRTKAELLDARRARAVHENESWYSTMRTTLPQGRTIGAPGRRLDAPQRLSFLEAASGTYATRGRSPSTLVRQRRNLPEQSCVDARTGRDKWWGTTPLHYQSVRH